MVLCIIVEVTTKHALRVQAKAYAKSAELQNNGITKAGINAIFIISAQAPHVRNHVTVVLNQASWIRDVFEESELNSDCIS